MNRHRAMGAVAVTALIAGMVLGAGARMALAQSEIYTCKTSENGLVRLNTKTGVISTCTEKNGQMICRLAADQRTAFLEEIERVQTDNEALRARLKRAGQTSAPKSALKDRPAAPERNGAPELARIGQHFSALMARFMKFSRAMREKLIRKT